MNKILGFTNKKRTGDILRTPNDPIKVQSSIVHKDEDDDFMSSINHISSLEDEIFENDKVSVFFVGNCFNLKEIQTHFSISNTFIPKIVYQFNLEGRLEKLLALMNGTFIIVISDRERKVVKIISDRFGLYPLYYYCENEQFAWCSKVKGILNLPFVSSELSHKAIDCFMEHGHLLGDHTYFRNIHMVPPASMLTYNYENDKFANEKYWTWRKVKPRDISFEEAVEQTGYLFIQAVERQFCPNGKMGVSLSGGLDSRLIIAAIDKLYPDYYGFAYTFGQKNCLDAKIAKQVTEVANWKHQFYLIDENNWLKKRLDSILETEGMKSIEHLHGCEHVDLIKNKIRVNLNGYLGDVILGRSYYSGLNEKLDKQLAKKIYSPFAELTNPNDSYYNELYPDTFKINNRGRRLINLGLIAMSPNIEQRRPFLDNDLVSFLISLPNDYRFKHRLYRAVALKFFPSYFSDIPWQKTGFPIKENLNFFIKVKHFLWQKLLKINPFSMPKDYSNYESWMGMPEMEGHLKEALLKQESPLLQFFEQTELIQFFERYQRNEKDVMEKIGRLFTLYYYFKSIDLK